MMHPAQQLDSLEKRAFLSFTAALSDHGVFAVTGSDSDDSISIALSADGTKIQATDNDTNTVVGEAYLSAVHGIRIDAGAGNDTVNVDAAITKPVGVLGGVGDDTLNVSAAGRNRVYGGDGNDTITTGAGRDFIDGGAGLDSINSGNGNDWVNGGDDNDTITVGNGNDRVYGGAGDDVITGGVAGVGKLFAAGGDGNDVITSEADMSFLYGQAGDDTITGSAGNDTIYGGDGTDSLDGGSGGTDSINEDDPPAPAHGHHGSCPGAGDSTASSTTGTSSSITRLASVFSRRRIH